MPISAIGLSLNESCLKEGSSVSIRCNVRGFPHPRIDFHKNNIEITPEAGMFENILLEFYDQARNNKIYLTVTVISIIDFHSPKQESVAKLHDIIIIIIIKIIVICPCVHYRRSAETN